jgi:hypothetical protein
MTRLPFALFLLAITTVAQADMGVLGTGTWVQRNGVLVLTVEEAGAARKLTYRTRGPDGKFMKGELTVVTMGDGKDSPMLVDGKPTAQSMAIKTVDANHTHTVLKLNGKDCGVSKAEVSADGKADEERGRVLQPGLRSGREEDRQHVGQEVTKPTICFAHAAYRLGDRFALRNTGLDWFEVRTLDDLKARIAKVDVLVVSGLWRNELIAGGAPARVHPVDQRRDEPVFERRAACGGHPARERAGRERARGGRARDRADPRHRAADPEARDNQAAKKWRGMVGEIAKREDELGGKTLAIVGMGRIGSRLATLAKAFDMRVIGVRQDPSRGAGPADSVVGEDALLEVLPQADFVVLTCPLTPRTENLIDAKALAAMKPSAYLINVARGKVVNEPALIEALAQKRIAGAALDTVWEEPLPATSPLWGMPNVLITPHVAGETRRYEENVIDILMETSIACGAARRR